MLLEEAGVMRKSKVATTRLKGPAAVRSKTRTLAELVASVAGVLAVSRRTWFVGFGELLVATAAGRPLKLVSV